MKCVESIDISALLDGELDREQSALLMLHLQQCEMCRRERERLLTLSAIYQQAPLLSPPAALDERITRSYREHFAGSPGLLQRIFSTRLALPLPLAAAALVMTVLGGFAAFKAGQMNSQPNVSVGGEPSTSIPGRRISEEVRPDVKPAVVTAASTEEAPPRVITRIVRVCGRAARKSQRPFFRVTPPPSKPTVLTATMTDNGYFTDLRLAGFEPPAELNAHVIKGVKK